MFAVFILVPPRLEDEGGEIEVDEDILDIDVMLEWPDPEST